ncbi:MAG TPA: formylglycine-generating enzyme family protein [Polyangiales bacterium]|jgi:formylglycine-generating enzyme required for sulfatase activity|nr:formylglycine-generating enzyme family protein [Polyangiales bacterium]
MRTARTSVVVALLLAAATADAAGRHVEVAQLGNLPVVRVPAGRWKPQYRPTRTTTELEVAAFWLMERPVTNGEFLAFVSMHPEYRRGAIASVFADERYLAHWQSPLVLGPGVRAEQPVTHVSWFAATAFCEAHGLRLPTEAEWELAAAASATRKDGGNDASFRRLLLDWYTAPRGELPDVPHGEPNVYGARDLHGVIWEWVDDFNNSVVIADSRNQGDTMRNSFCGADALVAQDTLDYPAFMRAAMRGSLEAPYTGTLLGFRCAGDGTLHPEKKR